MAAPTFVGVSTAAAAATSVSVAAPAGVAAGDHQLVFLGVPSTSETVTPPSGWELVRTQQNTVDATPFTLRVYRITTASATAAAAFTKSGSAQATAVRLAYRGGGGVESSNGSTSTSTTASHALGSVTTTVADSLVVAATYEDSASSSKTHTMPSPWTERADFNTLGGARVGMIAAYDMVKATPGAQGGTITSTAADHYATISVVLAGTSGPAAPTVDAGADATITLGQTFTRTATENDNGSAITARGWTIISGPQSVGSSTATQGVSFTPTVAGTFVLRYSATNSVGTSTDDMTLTVNPSAPVEIEPVDVIPFGTGNGLVHYAFDIGQENGGGRTLYPSSQIAGNSLYIYPLFLGVTDGGINLS